MTVFESIQSKNIEELVDWLDKYSNVGCTPWENWFDKNYCKKCTTITGYLPELYGEHECAWCELHHKCKYFQDMNKIPSRKQTIRLWLESESV